MRAGGHQLVGLFGFCGGEDLVQDRQDGAIGDVRPEIGLDGVADTLLLGQGPGAERGSGEGQPFHQDRREVDRRLEAVLVGDVDDPPIRIGCGDVLLDVIAAHHVEDDIGAALGADDFVAGYTAVYGYDSIRNENPIITGFKFNGVSVTPSCQNEECLTVPQQTPDCAGGDPCIDPCSKDGDPDCPAYDITAIVDPASAESDEVSKLAYDRSVSEQLWVDYYVDRGGVKSPVKLVNDAQKGFNDDYSTEFYAPKKSGTLSIWAVVHDNRGGMSWVRTEVGVR